MIYIYIKGKIRTYGNKFYTNFCCLNVPEDGKEREYFTTISVDSLFVYKNKYYLAVHLDNSAYIIVDKQMIDYFNGNLFDPNEDSFFDFDKLIL